MKKFLTVSLLMIIIGLSGCNETKTKNEIELTTEQSNKTILDEYILNRISKTKESKIYLNLDLKPNEK